MKGIIAILAALVVLGGVGMVGLVGYGSAIPTGLYLSCVVYILITAVLLVVMLISAPKMAKMMKGRSDNERNTIQ